MSMICIEAFETQTGDPRTVALGETADPNDPRVLDYPDKWSSLYELIAGGGGGGGSMPGGVSVRSVALNFDTPDLADGITAYTPAVGDLLLDAWVAVLETFDGTAALTDLSQFTSDEAPVGLFGETVGNPLDLQAVPESVSPGGGPAGGGPPGNAQYPLSLASIILAAQAASPSSVSNFQATFGNALIYGRSSPRRFESTDPLLWVVSQEGTKGGTPIDAMVGAAIGYVVVCSPVAA